MEPQWEGEKSLTAAGKDHTLTDRVCRFKTIGLNAETKKSVGIEPTGEIFLLTFTLIGHFYDREYRGANQNILHRIYFGMLVDLLTGSFCRRSHWLASEYLQVFAWLAAIFSQRSRITCQRSGSSVFAWRVAKSYSLPVTAWIHCSRSSAGKSRSALSSQTCAFAQNINSKNQVVGVAFDCLTDGGHAWLWENGGPIVDLNTLVLPGSTLTLELAENINDRGEIAGIGSPPGCGNPFVCGHAYVLIPCGEDAIDDYEGCREADATSKTVDENRLASTAPLTTTAAQLNLTPSEMRDRVRAFVSRQNRRFRGLQPK